MARKPRVMLIDMAKVFRSFPHGQITVHLTWTMDDRRPCLVLLPTLGVIHFDRVTPCIVKMDNAWRWDETTGSARYVAANSGSFCESLFGDVTLARCYKITDIIREHLDDLITCPPMPAVLQTEVAIATVTNRATGKTHQTGISEDV